MFVTTLQNTCSLSLWQMSEQTQLRVNLRQYFSDIAVYQKQFFPEHASLKNPQTVGVVERSHSAVKRILKLNTNEQWNDWFKYVQLAIFIHNTSYHSAIGCSPIVLFQGREPRKPLDLRVNNTLIERFSPNSENVTALKDAMKQKLS